MAERLRGSSSPYLLAHADNPVDWWPWSESAFEAARDRDVPVFLSIGYATCHWCHVMARESFSDPATASILNRDFVAIKVDREEHPEVDAAMLAAAAAFTPNLGWPLSVFATPDGGVFYAGTYYPPTPVAGSISFGQLLAAVTEAWRERRDEVDATAAALDAALARARESVPAPAGFPAHAVRLLEQAVAGCLAAEDPVHGGFGTAPKFPVAPVLQFLLGRPGDGRELALRTLHTMSDSGLRDPVEGGFFRYAVRADWNEPHYERMLGDNALLLDAYTHAALLRPDAVWAAATARGIAGFLLEVLAVPGGFASAQDSESTIDGVRSEGGYYARDAAGRAALEPPALDRKVLTAWNGLAIGALARAGAVLEEPRCTAAAAEAADAVLAVAEVAGRLPRARLDGRLSAAPAALEDSGMLAAGLLELALATGRVRYAVAARELVDATLAAGAQADGPVFGPPGGGDPVLAGQGRSFAADAFEGALPSGPASLAGAALTLHALTGDARYRAAAEATLSGTAELAARQPVAAGGLLTQFARAADPLAQLVVVQAAGVADPSPGGTAEAAAELVRAARRLAAERSATIVGVVRDDLAADWADAGFELFAGRTALGEAAAAYWCTDFVCRLPVTRADELARLR